jgi:hypothetical protein
MQQNQFVKNVVLAAIQYLLQMASKETNCCTQLEVILNLVLRLLIRT